MLAVVWNIHGKSITWKNRILLFPSQGSISKYYSLPIPLYCTYVSNIRFAITSLQRVSKWNRPCLITHKTSTSTKHKAQSSFDQTFKRRHDFCDDVVSNLHSLKVQFFVNSFFMLISVSTKLYNFQHYSQIDDNDCIALPKRNLGRTEPSPNEYCRIANP